MNWPVKRLTLVVMIGAFRVTLFVLAMPTPVPTKGTAKVPQVPVPE
jgi:hypothetical protein